MDGLAPSEPDHRDQLGVRASRRSPRRRSRCPRLNVPYEMVWETDCYPDGRCMMWGTTESLEPDGWRGSFVGWIDQSGVSAVGMSVGTGANEGLTTVGGFSGGDLSGNNTVDTLIHEGDPPPLP